MQRPNAKMPSLLHLCYWHPGKVAFRKLGLKAATLGSKDV